MYRGERYLCGGKESGQGAFGDYDVNMIKTQLDPTDLYFVYPVMGVRNAGDNLSSPLPSAQWI